MAKRNISNIFENLDKVLGPEIEVDMERFKEERDRISRYLSMLSERKASPSEIIDILRDLDVITDTHGVGKDEIINQLRQLLCKVKR